MHSGAFLLGHFSNEKLGVMKTAHFMDIKLEHLTKLWKNAAQIFFSYIETWAENNK